MVCLLGELGIIIAPTGIGKSMVLVHLGSQALKIGKNVIHYTLELNDKMIGLRYDSCLTGIPINELMIQKDFVLEKITNKTLGKLLIKYFPTNKVSVNSLKNHLEKIKETNQEIDLIIVDYGDLLCSLTKRERRFELEEIYQDLRNLAAEFLVPLYTASQTNRARAQY